MSSDKAEFANFFDLLVRLASKENREDFSIPRDLAPLLQRLETVLANQDATNPLSASKSRNLRRKSHADGNVAKFPLAEEYPFTFKLMIHKLYDMDEWAKKVKEVVEESQCQYKPLVEELKNSPKSPREHSGTHEEEDDRIRAVKKRRTGRTRAVSGPSIVPKSSWISNATQAIPKDICTPQSSINTRPRYQSLSRLDTNTRPLKRTAPIEEEPFRPAALKTAKAAQFAALSNDALRTGAKNFQVKRRVRSSTLSTAPSGNAVAGNKRPIIP